MEDSLKDLSSVKWRTEHNGKRLWPHDQWPERDLVNFPPYKLREVPNAVRWYCVPESWFKFFYEKTGVTGPYMFFYGLLVYGFSKEHIVLWYDFTEYLILAAAVITVVKKYAPSPPVALGPIDRFVVESARPSATSSAAGTRKKLTATHRSSTIPKPWPARCSTATKSRSSAPRA